MLKIADIELSEKTVFLRCELNVAMSEDGVADFTRIDASRPTIELLKAHGCRVVICSHMGRPWGQRDASKSLRQLVSPLESVLQAEVQFVGDCIGAERDDAVAALDAGGVLLLENVRYYSEENDNDTEFGKALVRGIDLYVNDAFGNCHRPHASMVAAALAAPQRCAGLLLERELHELDLMNNPAYRPSLSIIGGAKVSGKDGKLFVVENLLTKVDRVAVVGKLAYYFLLASGTPVGSTLSGDTRGIDAPDASPDKDLDACSRVLRYARELGKPLLLPTDSVVSDGNTDSVIDFAMSAIPPAARALDIGPATLADIRETIEASQLVVWNGPAGYFEQPAYRNGTLSIARALNSFSGHAVVGGGDTVAAVSSVLQGANPAIHICTGGGAMLTWLMGAELPAVAALDTVVVS